jgi:hypothetical protein
MNAHGTPWLFIGTLTLFSLFWVFTLVPFVLSLSFRPRAAQAAPRSVREVHAALVGLGRAGRPWRLTPLSDRGFRLDWDVVDGSWYERFAKVKLSVVYRMRLYLQERTHEVRTYESIRTGAWFLGFVGWTPRFSSSWTYAGGALNVIWAGRAYGITRGFPPRIGEVYRFTLDTAEVKREIETVANAAGWTLYPTTLPFEVSPWAVRLGELLTPSAMHGWSRRKFWGVLHAVSWAGILASLLGFVPWTPHNLGVLALVVGGILAVCALVVGGWRAIDWLSVRRSR